MFRCFNSILLQIKLLINFAIAVVILIPPRSRCCKNNLDKSCSLMTGSSYVSSSCVSSSCVSSSPCISQLEMFKCFRLMLLATTVNRFWNDTLLELIFRICRDDNFFLNPLNISTQLQSCSVSSSIFLQFLSKTV